MPKFLGTLFLLSLFSIVSCQREDKVCEDESTLEEYDKDYADLLGADEYGMRPYVMAILKSGDNRPTDKTISDSLLQAHLSNIKRMADEGVLVLAGPFYEDSTDHQGIYIFNVETIEEARELTNSDPAIQYGSLKMELHKWYGSAALLEINSIHKQISKTDI